jgi:serine/threonine-protein kinase
MIQVLGALEEAHGAGIVHRDLKPENILITSQGGIADFPKVLDFGLAKITEQRMHPGSMVLTREGMVFGTPEFMSPEQARGETLDARSDIYSLGIIFYEMLTARLPFPRSKPMEYIAHHINTPPYKITERRPELNLPEALNPIVGKALEKNRDGRYESASAFAAALETLLPSNERTRPVYTPPAAGRAPAERRGGEKGKGPQGEATRADGKGKGLHIALLAVIALLLAAVIFLFATRGDEPAALPPQAPGQPPPAQQLPPPQQ